ncbi:MAG: T9SS type A sorting domain-containing protein, partial [Flavobacteriales bacterium]
MKILYVFFSLVCCGISLQLEAQNIVPNGGFEEITSCPSGGAQIFRAPPWRSSANSPDLYNTCGDFGYSVPENLGGTQTPREGEGYAGFSTYVNHPSFVDAREFIKCTLDYGLVAGEIYYVEFYVSQRDSMEYATHNLGVTFTDVDTGEFGELLCWPGCNVYVENTSANPLTSKTEWVKVSGTFTALGGERYIHLGNFRTDEDSEIEFIGGGVGPEYDWFVSGYYIDDVWLSHVDSMNYLGVDDLPFGSAQSAHLEVYPNPTNSSLQITSKGSLQPQTVSVYSIEGKLVKTEPWKL